MAIEDFKRWHWAAIGLLAGLAIGGGHVMMGPDFDLGIGRTLDQLQFEQDLTRLAPDHLPRVRTLVVHPPIDKSGSYWVTGEWLSKVVRQPKDPKNPDGPAERVERFLSFMYEAMTPYQPLAKNTPASATVIDYLNRIKQQSPAGEVNYRYAWWETKPATLLLWSGGGLLLVGVIWPILVNVLIGAGLARTPNPQGFDWRNMKGRKLSKAAKTKAGLSEQDEKKLAEMNSELEQQLAGDMALTGKQDSRQDSAKSVPVSVKHLSGEGATDPIAIPPEAATEYKGEFYPVAKSGPQSPKSDK